MRSGWVGNFCCCEVRGEEVVVEEGDGKGMGAGWARKFGGGCG